MIRKIFFGLTVFFSSEKGFTEFKSIQLPPEIFIFKPGRGSEIASAYCITCHSTDYISTQPSNLTQDFWKSTVLKMKNTFGALIPENQVEPLVGYLVKHYGVEPKKKNLKKRSN